jgi:hypothetical protein
MNAEQEKLIGREFQHFKGNLYRLEGFAKDYETLEEMVVYRALGPLRPLRGSGFALGQPDAFGAGESYGERGLWVRPAKMFFETIERDGRTMKRFEPVEDEQ